MKNRKCYLITGFIFSLIMGTLAHFFYDWSGENPLIGLVSPVSESTWEHMKLVFFPVLLWSFFLPGRLSDKYHALRPALLLGGLIGTLAVPILFYTYSGILGHNVTWIDIMIFIISVFLTFRCTWKLQDSEKVYECRTVIYFLTVLSAALFLFFTFQPPGIGLFAVP